MYNNSKTFQKQFKTKILTVLGDEFLIHDSVGEVY